MKSKRRQLLILGITLAVLFVFGQWWVDWPHRTAAKFIGLMSRADFEAASDMLAAPSSLEVTETGVQIRDVSGDAALVSSESFPFLAAELTELAGESRGFVDVLLARDLSGLAATGAGKPEPRAGAVHFFKLTIERGRIQITSIESL